MDPSVGLRVRRPEIRPADALQVFAFEDDYSFGILHSSTTARTSRSAARRCESTCATRPNTVFDTFPWPQAPTEEAVDAVAAVSARLIAFRDERLADGLSLEQQYNSLRDPGRNPLRTLQEELDVTVADAYGFSPDDDPLAQLLSLNLSIAEQENSGLTEPRRPGNNGLAGTHRTTTRIVPPPLR